AFRMRQRRQGPASNSRWFLRREDPGAAPVERRQPGVRARSPSQERPRPSVHARAADRAASRRHQCDVASESDVRATEPRIAACRRRRYGGLPFARARELLDLTDDEVLLQTAKPVDKTGALEVIHLVLRAARDQ